MKSSALKEFLLDTFGHLSFQQLMSLTIYGEARGESYEGKVAVASVIMERVKHRAWDGEDIQEVCLMPYQFSCYLPDDPNFQALKLIADDWDNKFTQSPPLRECCQITALLLSGSIGETPEIEENKATQYLTTAYRSHQDKQAAVLQEAGKKDALKKLNQKRWWIRMKRVATIGNHEFYA